MAQFRTTADYVDAVLNRAGEPTNGNSSYEADALTYLNKIHHDLVSGGLIFDVTVDDDWAWARAKRPYVLELQPKYSTGTVSLTLSSEAATFSAAPAYSVAGWFFQAEGEQTTYRIISHTAAATAFELDGAYVGTTGSKAFKVFKLDYEVLPSYLYVETGKNDKLDFVRTGTTEVTVTLTAGSYTPSALATHVASVIQAGAGGTSTYGCTYDSVTRKFTLTSNRQGGDVFYLLGATGTNLVRSALPLLGFDDTDTTNAASFTSTYILGGISRITAPMKVYNSSLAKGQDVRGLDSRVFASEHPVSLAQEKLPTVFTVTEEGADGSLVVRFDNYPSEKSKLEVTVTPVPRDLKDNAASIPLVPRKFADILEYGAAYFILVDKEDDKAQGYVTFAERKLKTMQNENRSLLKKADPYFGEIIPRLDSFPHARRRFRYGYDRDDQ